MLIWKLKEIGREVELKTAGEEAKASKRAGELNQLREEDRTAREEIDQL